MRMRPSRSTWRAFPTACAMVDAAAAGYDAFISNEGYSYVMRGRVRFWTAGVAREFDRVNVIS